MKKVTQYKNGQFPPVLAKFNRSHMVKVRKMWQDDGRWLPVVSKLYRELTQMYTAAGCKPGDAAFSAYRDCYARFPPLPEPAQNKTVDALARQTSTDYLSAQQEKTKQEQIRNNGIGDGDEELDQAAIAAIAERTEEVDEVLYEEILWVYRHIDHTQETATTKAPSTGAYSMWRWARKNRKMFYEKILPRAISARERDQQALKDDGGDTINLCRKITKEVQQIRQRLGSATTMPSGLPSPSGLPEMN